MTSRLISTLGILQLGFVFGILVASRIVFRILEYAQHLEGRPLPAFMQFVDQYSLYLLLVPIVWTAVAATLLQRPNPAWRGFSTLVGVLLSLALILLFVLVITFPFLPLIVTLNQQ